MIFIRETDNHLKKCDSRNCKKKFWVHLKLLLWKNYLIRKRNKFRTVTEVVWPVLMILVVVFLHQVGRRLAFPNCHMKAKAMPTAGEVLFLQTFFCSINNTCDTERNSSMPSFNSSLVSYLGEALQEAFKLSPVPKPNSGDQTDTGEEMESEGNQEMSSQLKAWTKDFFLIESLIETIKKHQNEKWNATERESFFKNHSTNYTCDNVKFSFFDEIRPSPLDQSLKESDEDLALDDDGSDVRLLTRLKRKIYLAGVLNSFYHLLTKKIHNDKNGDQAFLQVQNILDYVLCGPNVPKLMDQFSSLLESGRRKSRENEDAMNPGGSKYIVEEPEWENDTTDFCNDLMRKLESTYASRIVFRLFKPLIRGKLIYTPDAPVINKIMSRFNESLTRVRTLIDAIKNAAEVSAKMNDWRLDDIVNKYKNEEFFLRDIVETKIVKTLLKHFDNDTEGKEEEFEIHKVQRILDETVESWRNVLSSSEANSNFSRLIPYLECIDLNRIIPIRDENMAVKEALSWLNHERLLGLIVFMNVSSDAEELPPSLTYKIRTGIERTPDTSQIRDRVFVPSLKRSVIYDLREITGGFAYLQNLIEGELIREYTGRKTVPGIYMKQVPYPCHVYDSFRDVITRTFPMFMVISWIYIFCTIAKRIVLEKEILFKGTLRIFGVTTSQHWISWFIDAFLPMVLVTSILSVVLVYGGLIPNSSIFLIWLFLTTFVLPTITLAFLVSTFFVRASFAMAVSGMIYFLLYLPYPPIQNFEEIINPYFKVFACLVSNVAFGLGCTWIANMEEIGVGAQLSKINYSPVAGNPITMGLIIEMFLIDSLIYFLLALYFDKIFSTTDFVRQPWYYYFTSSYWRGSSKKLKDIPPTPQPPQPNPTCFRQTVRDPRYFEAEPSGLSVGIEVLNLTKVFGTSKRKKTAVNDLTINFYENQITSFLGRNGAGKTTTISMMIGLLPITRGTVRIYGADIKNNPHVAVKDIGICRQENVLLDDLTVEEHFRLFARLKNRLPAEVDSEVEELLGDLQLGHRAKQPVKILSGGMKRKVCVAMAFIGRSRTVFLDEPTAGIDPCSRRSIWELLVKYKKGRTIILTTHFLDEADLLGDRIAIISSGKLQCYGSSMFLKSQLGRGYYLTIESNIRSDKMGRKAIGPKKDVLDSAQIQELDNLIKKIVPEAEFSEQIGSEIVFILPTQTRADDYNRLFLELDRNKKELNFSSYGVTDTSLEEIFMKILLEAKSKEENLKDSVKIKDSDAVEAKIVRKSDKKEIDKEDASISPSQKALKLSARTMLREHFVALITKRFLHHSRNFKILLVELLLPTLFMAIALALAKTLPTITEMPPLAIDMSAYSPCTYFYSNDIPENPHTSSYEDVLLGPYGFGTKCILSPEKCSFGAIPRGSLVANNTAVTSKECSCKKGFFECINNENLEKLPHAQMSTGDRLYNLTGLNLTHWLISNELEYSDHRYGGVSFGYFTALTGMSCEEFLNFFMFERFIKITEKLVVRNDILIDPEVFTLLLMSTSCNKTFGDEFFKDRDPADNIIIWYNNRGWIAGIAMMNGITNLVLRASLPNGTDSSKYSISLINHPLPITKRQLEDQIELQTNIALLCALSVIWALSFIPAMYAVYLVEERMSGLKHLQIVSGISRIVYWCTNLIWDLISYSISIFAIIFLYFLFDMSAFISDGSIGAFVLLLYSYGIVNISFVYIISFWFSVPSSAFIFVACWNILAGVATLLSDFTLSLISNKENPFYLNTIFMLFPQFSFGKSLTNMAIEGIRSQSLENFGVKPVKNHYGWDLTMKYVVIILTNAVIFFGITLLIEYRVFQRFVFDELTRISWKKMIKCRDREKDDEDVKKERERVESGKAKEDGDVLIINNLTKVYSKKESPAVDHISVGIKRGECFGLLGLNGAGKTTVFKMLTGFISPTEGDAIIGGYSIRGDPRKAKLLVGYCPQVNALDPYLTAEEHLSFFCRIRGVTGTNRQSEVSLNIERLGLTECKHKIVKVLSGGNKRKVNTAIALACDPELVLLDEPTSGMDVLSRRFLWNCLQDVVLKGRCVVLTSHSMEECQALCTHLSIMVNGRFTCFGSSQHLKNKFNEGYTVAVRLFDSEKVEDVMNYFETNLPDSTLVHVHYLQIKFKLSPSIFIGTAFKTLSEAKEKKLIQDYSISQTTLESIFLQLAMSAQNVKNHRSNYGFYKNLCCSCGKNHDEVR